MRFVLKKWHNIFLLNIETFLLFAMIVVTSWAYLMPTTFFDEIITILLFFNIIFTNKKLNKSFLKTIIFYVIWCSGGLFINRRINLYALIQLFDNLKPVLILLCILAIRMTKERIELFLKMFEIINFPSIVIGILTAYMYNHLHLNRIIESGTLKRYGDDILLRAGGLIGHSGAFSETCAILFLLVLFQEKNNIKKWIKISFYALGLYCGKGRFPLFMVILGTLWYIWRQLPKKTQKYLIVFIVFIVNILSYPTFQYFKNIFMYDFNNQIRFHALKIVFILLANVILFGVGVGNIGNIHSITNNYDLYLGLNMIKYGYIDWESHLAKSLLQTGIVGTIIWYFPFFKCLFKIYNTKQEKYRDILLFFILYYIVNSFLNKSYNLPFLLLLCVLISSKYYENNYIAK